MSRENGRARAGYYRRQSGFFDAAANVRDERERATDHSFQLMDSSVSVLLLVSVV